MDILFATGNEHKKNEVAQMLPHHNIIMPKELGIQFDPEETGTSFLENALIKAKELHRLTGKPVLADDSGISVEYLGGMPGIYSARYGEKEAGKTLSAEEKNSLLLKQMKGIKNRKAAFVCSMILYINDNRFFTAQESLEGEIIDQPEGSGGFGYDPIVFLPNKKKTVAQLLPEEKNKISHRGKALAAISKILENLEDVNDTN